MTFVPLVGFFALLLLAFAFHYLEALSRGQTMPLPLKSPSTRWIFVKWLALYKAQGISSTVLAVHLRGTVFLNYWFEILGARIGSSVLLDTVDITDPSLVSIGDEVVIAEGVLVQIHEVKNGILSFHPIRIGKCSSIGPYVVIQKGSVIEEGAEVQALQKVGQDQHVFKPAMLTKNENYLLSAKLNVISSTTLWESILLAFSAPLLQSLPTYYIFGSPSNLHHPSTSPLFAYMVPSIGYRLQSLHMLPCFLKSRQIPSPLPFHLPAPTCFMVSYSSFSPLLLLVSSKLVKTKANLNPALMPNDNFLPP
ncbi:hypothetical protein JHK87_030762 [Glycine soja]|nr:hypothetical protein JHK87_030762 [Glycine soja]